MQESLVFLILGVGRLREDQLIYVETRQNMFSYDMEPLRNYHSPETDRQVVCRTGHLSGRSCSQMLL